MKKIFVIFLKLPDCCLFSNCTKQINKTNMMKIEVTETNFRYIVKLNWVDDDNKDCKAYYVGRTEHGFITTSSVYDAKMYRSLIDAKKVLKFCQETIKNAKAILCKVYMSAPI